MPNNIHRIAPEAGTSLPAQIFAFSRDSCKTDAPLSDVQEWFQGNKLRDTDFTLANGLIHGVAPYVVADGGVFVAVPA
jgi:hypothetical protein